MLYTININEDTVEGKQFLKQLQSYKDVVSVENPSVTGYIPDGYMTIDKFNNHSSIMIKQILTNHITRK